MGRKPKIHEPLEFSFNAVLDAVADGAPESTLLPVKPFVKWVGGKRSIIDELQNRLPDEYTRYYEVFMGGGALFYAIQPENAYIADTNFHLIMTYRAIRDDVGRVIRNLKIHESKHRKDYYLKCRKHLSSEPDYIKVAALLIYINRTCFNGLYRVNKSGGFNVPMGDYKNPLIVDETNLRNVSIVLESADIVQHGFEHTPIQEGAFYYLDPPYHKTFSNYTSGGFGTDEHEKLADFCNQINDAEAYFMLSNSDTDFVNNLYNGYLIETVAALRSVSCKAHQRGREDEVIIRNYE